jgi:hypothetical protein
MVLTFTLSWSAQLAVQFTLRVFEQAAVVTH